MNFFSFIIDYFKRLKIPKKHEITLYYPKYLLAHKNPINKLLHILGNILTILYVVIVLYYSSMLPLSLLLLLLTPFIVYLGAWPGHYWFEKNKPATFKTNPLLTKSCDWIMIFQLLTGKLSLDTRKKDE